jgi:hypothetical protein
MKKIIIALSILLFSFIYLSKSKDEKIVLHTNKRKKNSSNIEKIQIDKTVFKNHTKQFTNQGWKKAETTAPDENLVGLSLNLDEKLLANQISSNIFSEKDLEHLYQIALTSKEYKTKYLAIEAMGNIEGSKKDRLLIKLFQQSKFKIKKDILRYFKPEGNNQTAKFIVNNILLDKNEDNLHSDALDLLASSQVFFDNNNLNLIDKLPILLKQKLNKKISSIQSALLN